MRNFLSILVAVISVSIMPLAAQEKSVGAVDKTYDRYYGAWGKDGDIVVRWAVNNVDGRLQVCGAYSSTGKAIIQKFNRALLKEAKIQINGQTVRKNMRFFKRLANEGRENNHFGQPTNCRMTKHAYQAGEYLFVTRGGSYKVSR